MRIQGAVIGEQGQAFAVVVVKQQVVQNSSAAAETIRSITQAFRVPVALMRHDSRGRRLRYAEAAHRAFLRVPPIRRSQGGADRGLLQLRRRQPAARGRPY